jgi:hypothetical protein
MIKVNLTMPMGVLVAAVAGVVAGWQSHAREIKPLDPVRVVWSWLAVHRSLRMTLTILVSAVMSGLTLGYILGTQAADQAFGRSWALLFIGIVGESLGGLLGGLAMVLITLLTIVTVNSITPRNVEINEIKKKSDPGARMRTTAYTGFVVSSVGFVVCSLVYGLVLGVPAALIIWLKFGGATYLRYLFLRFLLASTGVTPWRFVKLLEEAVRLDFLRPSVGAGYQFSHSKLLDHFVDYLPHRNSELSTSVNYSTPTV